MEADKCGKEINSEPYGKIGRFDEIIMNDDTPYSCEQEVLYCSSFKRQEYTYIPYIPI
jgi:hypothetical protein